MPKPSANGHTGYPALKRPATLDHLRSKPRPWRIVGVCVSIDAQNALREAEVALGDASLAAEGEGAGDARQEALRAAEANQDRARAAVEKATMDVLFVSVGRKRYHDLIDEFTTAPEPTADVPEPSPQIDHAALNVALVAASCAVPEDVTVEDVRQWSEEWNVQEFEKLLAATIEVNTQSGLVTLGPKSPGTNVFARS